MKKQSIKLNESQLREIIKEAINEFRGGYSYDDQDGDIRYVRPNGKPYASGENWKTMYNSPSVGDKRGKRAYERDRTTSTPNMYNYGKGKLCFQLLKNLSETFQIEMAGLEAEPSGKINWTPEELKRISDIYMQIMSLAKLSKEEGTRTRGQQPQTV